MIQDMKTLKIKDNYEILLDDEDFELYSKFNWYLSRGRTTVYAGRDVRYGPRKENKKRRILLHREIMNASEHEYVDHINGNGLDNRKSNLRKCSNADNLKNRSSTKNNKLGLKGISLDKRLNLSKRFKVAITYNGIYKFIGRFETKEEAIAAYNEAAIKYHGDFAWLNRNKND
jgi:hypothetical protein